MFKEKNYKTKFLTNSILKKKKFNKDNFRKKHVKNTIPKQIMWRNTVSI